MVVDPAPQAPYGLLSAKRERLRKPKCSCAPYPYLGCSPPRVHDGQAQTGAKPFVASYSRRRKFWHHFVGLNRHPTNCLCFQGISCINQMARRDWNGVPTHVPDPIEQKFPSKTNHRARSPKSVRSCAVRPFFGKGDWKVILRTSVARLGVVA